jgi:hypothetical protein
MRTRLHLLQHTATHCNTMLHTATQSKWHCLNAYTPTPTATHCNTLQCTATHCNTMLHTATQSRWHCLNVYTPTPTVPCSAVCCCVLLWLEVCCSMLQCVCCVFPTVHMYRPTRCSPIRVHYLLYVCRTRVGLRGSCVSVWVCVCVCVCVFVCVCACVLVCEEVV